MYSRRSRAISLIEIILVCTIASIVLATSGLAWNRAATNRKLDTTVAEIEAALILARQTAQNRDGAYLAFTPPQSDKDGQWTIYPGQKKSIRSESAIKTSPIPQVITLETTPSSLQVIQFNSAGSVDKKQTSTDSEGNCALSLSVNGKSREITLTIIGMTGAIMKKTDN